jgi:hypothetical protein
MPRFQVSIGRLMLLVTLVAVLLAFGRILVIFLEVPWLYLGLAIFLFPMGLVVLSLGRLLGDKAQRFLGRRGQAISAAMENCSFPPEGAREGSLGRQLRKLD